jgi:hypothetical protein
MAAKILIQGSIIRAAYGLLALLFPKFLFASVGMNEADVDPEARYFNRLFGGRDLLVAGATVAAVKAGAETPALKANLLCEFTDSVSLAEELRSRGKLDRVVGYLTWIRALLAR